MRIQALVFLPYPDAAKNKTRVPKYSEIFTDEIFTENTLGILVRDSTVNQCIC